MVVIGHPSPFHNSATHHSSMSLVGSCLTHCCTKTRTRWVTGPLQPIHPQHTSFYRSLGFRGQPRAGLSRAESLIVMRLSKVKSPSCSSLPAESSSDSHWRLAFSISPNGSCRRSRPSSLPPPTTPMPSPIDACCTVTMYLLRR
jgi:hypothetical protein